MELSCDSRPCLSPSERVSSLCDGARRRPLCQPPRMSPLSLPNGWKPKATVYFVSASSQSSCKKKQKTSATFFPASCLLISNSPFSKLFHTDRPVMDVHKQIESSPPMGTGTPPVTPSSLAIPLELFWGSVF